MSENEQTSEPAAPDLREGHDGQVAISGPGIDHGSAPAPMTHEGAKLKLGGTTIAWGHDDLEPGDSVVLIVEAIVTEAGGKIALGKKHSPTRSWREHVAVVTEAKRLDRPDPLLEQAGPGLFTPTGDDEPEAAPTEQDALDALPNPLSVKRQQATQLRPGMLVALLTAGEDPDGASWAIVDARLTDAPDGHIRVTVGGDIYEFAATEPVAWEGPA